MPFILQPGKLNFADLHTLLDEKTELTLDPHCHAAIHASADFIGDCIAKQKVMYGINTGFGSLAHTRIAENELQQLQYNLILSHAAGTGELLPDHIVRLIMILKINSLARGYSGIRLSTINALINLLNARLYPCIPAQGSVGASGDLAPLAHLSAVLIGEGEVRHDDKIISAKEALKIIGLSPLTLAPKEGLALLNGTQVSTAIALSHLFSAEKIFLTALVTGALSVEATRGSHAPFDERIHLIRGHQNQIKTAEILRDLLKDSRIHASHEHCAKVQDPYSLRCQPQVMGACLDSIAHAASVLLTEANAVSDNPLIFVEEQVVLSGGNFHAEPVALAADQLAIALAEIGAIAERRIALLIDTHFSGLPPFLVENPGINSGFMIAQVTAAALASENKSLAHPASVDSLPTSANQEDHVSMATFAARRLEQMVDNCAVIIGIELLAACQGLDFLKPLTSSSILQTIHQLVRKKIAFYAKDRYFAPDIAASKALVLSNEIYDELNHHAGSLF